MLIATGVLVFANLVIVFAPTMLSATLMEHLTVIAKLASVVVLITMGGVAFTSKKESKEWKPRHSKKD